MRNGENLDGETFTMSNTSPENEFTNKTETVTGNSEADVAEKLEGMNEEESLIFRQKVESAKEADGEKAQEIKFELQIQEQEQQAMSAKAIEAQEALAGVIDSIQEKKIPIEERIKDETHFKEAFPALSFFSWFGMGRNIAKTMYADEYKIKVENKEEADENTLSRLNEREMEAEAQIASLRAGGEINSKEGVATMVKQLEAVTELLKEINKLEKEADNLTTKGPESKKEEGKNPSDDEKDNSTSASSNTTPDSK